MRSKLFLFAALILGFGFSAVADEASSDAQVEFIMKLARDNLSKTKAMNGKFIEVETAEEKRTPLITIEEAKKAIKVGEDSTIAQWCGIDWRKSIYLPFILHETNSTNWNDKQLIYIGLIHGISKEMHDDAVKQSGRQCEEKTRKYIQDKIATQTFE